MAALWPWGIPGLVIEGQRRRAAAISFPPRVATPRWTCPGASTAGEPGPVSGPRPESRPTATATHLEHVQRGRTLPEELLTFPRADPKPRGSRREWGLPVGKFPMPGFRPTSRSRPDGGFVQA